MKLSVSIGMKLSVSIGICIVYCSVAKNATSIHEQIKSEVWLGENPIVYSSPSFIDPNYPHTAFSEKVFEGILKSVSRPSFYLEVGTMLGGSALRAANVLKRLNFTTSIVCVDPFTGDVNMLAWEKQLALEKKWRFSRNEMGRPTVYDRFRANVFDAGFKDTIIPIIASSFVGMKLIKRLYMEKRISELPQIIYLDSAHEPHETLLELHLAWHHTLGPNGILFGDDWVWPAVRDDVSTFANSMMRKNSSDQNILANLQSSLGCKKINNILLLHEATGQWIMAKKEI